MQVNINTCFKNVKCLLFLRVKEFGRQNVFFYKIKIMGEVTFCFQKFDAGNASRDIHVNSGIRDIPTKF